MSLVEVKTLECPACNAPYAINQAHCSYCGSALPRIEQPQPSTQPDPQLANKEIVDYYALLGINPLHLLPGEPPPPLPSGPFTSDSRAAMAAIAQRRPPNALEVQEAAITAQQRLLLGPGLSPAQRDEQIEQIEIAEWVLANERARFDYDSALIALRDGNYNQGHFSLLADLRRRALEALGKASGPLGSGSELLRQGSAYLALGMYQDAIAALRQAVEALPDSTEAHSQYAQALLASEDPVAAGPHKLRQAGQSFAAALALNPNLTDAQAYAALCRGLLARQEGDLGRAAGELRQATALLPRFGLAWRALAALAYQSGDDGSVLTYCRQALLANAKDEHAYALLVAACWRSGQRSNARDAAARLAALRGPAWNSERVLNEIVGN